MAKKLDLNRAERIRTSVTKKQEKQIRDMYRKIAKEIEEEAKKLPDTTSGVLRGMYLSKLKGEILEQLGNLGDDLEGLIKGNMESVADGIVAANIDFLQKINLSVQGAFLHVPKDVVESVITGKVYQDNWSLSKAIWKHTQKATKDINRIIAEGIAKNKSALEIAKDLEKYVNPDAKKPWDWSKVYPGTSLKIDYNAQRLARTLVSHAYQQAFVRTTQKNPFVTMYRWEASNSARSCPLCASRDGVLFDKDKLPLDHPNGMCTYTAVMEDSMIDISNRIAAWANGAHDPELDEYYEFLSNP